MAEPIRAIITDVDGVMVGKKKGVNFPLPADDVMRALEKVQKHGVPVVLCSSKHRTAIDPIISRAGLSNPHITDNGALIINPLGMPKIIDQHVIDRLTVSEYLAHDEAYTELYTAAAYYAEKGRNDGFMQERAKLLMMKPVVVDSLAKAAQTLDIIKIGSWAEDEDDMPRIEAQAERLGSHIHYIWSHHPSMMPRRPCVITAPGISKGQAATQVVDYLGIPLESILGIGDLPPDWDFMKLCGSVATVGDNQELRELCAQKGRDHAFSASTVDNLALLEIFEHFGIRYTWL